jgi:hypothetical protein
VLVCDAWFLTRLQSKRISWRVGTEAAESWRWRVSSTALHGEGG